MSDKKEYPVIAPFRRNAEVFRKGTIKLTADEAAPLIASKLITEPEAPSKDESKKVAAADTKGEAVDRNTLFAEAVAKLDKANNKHFTNSNAPDVKALAEVGFVTTAAERNELWAALNPAA